MLEVLIIKVEDFEPCEQYLKQLPKFDSATNENDLTLESFDRFDSISFEIDKEVFTDTELVKLDKNNHDKFDKEGQILFVLDFTGEGSTKQKWSLMKFENPLVIENLCLHHFDEIFRMMKTDNCFVWYPAKIIGDSIYTMDAEFKFNNNEHLFPSIKILGH